MGTIANVFCALASTDSGSFISERNIYCASAFAISMKKLPYHRITTTIEREWLAQIVVGTKKIEYRHIKPYWTKRLEKVSVPFEIAAAERNESASAGSDGADPQKTKDQRANTGYTSRRS